MAYTPQIYYPNSYTQQFQSQYQQPMIPTQMSGTPAPQAQNNSGLIWVTGEVGAKSYLVAPNQSVLLMDSEGDRFYLKSTDGAGMPTLRTFEYKEVLQNAPQPANLQKNNMNEQYVTRDEYNELLARIDDMQKPKTAKKKEVNENE